MGRKRRIKVFCYNFEARVMMTFGFVLGIQLRNELNPNLAGTLSQIFPKFLDHLADFSKFRSTIP